jgi:hypothetical protein
VTNLCGASDRVNALVNGPGFALFLRWPCAIATCEASVAVSPIRNCLMSGHLALSFIWFR